MYGVRMRSLPRALHPFRQRHYRWLAASLTLSLLSEGMWLVGAVWQVVHLHGGPSSVSMVTTGAAVGLLATVLLGGAIADRIPQRRILMTVEAVRMLVLAAAASLAALGLLTIWQLALVSLVAGLASGLYFPAYSALLPALVPARDLLPANGIEGVLRPIVLQAAGPAIGGALVAAIAPSAALGAAACASAAAGLCIAALPTMAVRRDLSHESSDLHPIRHMLHDIAEGFRYMVRTRWLLVTVLYASAMILFVMGPLEVLVPFAVRDRAGGGPQQHALVLAAFGTGGALASITMASLPLPRRYLTVMNVMWGFGSLPLIVFGVSTHLSVMLVGAFLTGAMFNAPMVIWGTLLQRRVPPELLGRVSSLDFFVSLTLMPVSMALAGPVAETVGLTATFLVAAIAPVGIIAIVLAVGGLQRDELEHPLDEHDAG